MSSLPASTADTDSQTALNALRAADNANFILAVDQAILDAIAQGETQISANTFGNVNAQTVTEYYVNLGYKVSFPDFRTNIGNQPAQLFGDAWVSFWQGTLAGYLGFVPKNPMRLLIGWSV